MQGAPISSRIAASKTITRRALAPRVFLLLSLKNGVLSVGGKRKKTRYTDRVFRDSSVGSDFFQLGVSRHQPLDAFAIKGDLHAALRTAAFKVNDGAFTKFRMLHT